MIYNNKLLKEVTKLTIYPEGKNPWYKENE